MSYLAQNVGQIIKYETLASDTGLSRTAVIKYLDLLEQCFIVKRVNAYSKNLANELKKGKKVYFCDLGVRNAVLRNFAPLTSRPNEIGALWENFFFMERYKRHVYDQDFTEMYFWRSTGTNAQEIDFIEIQDGKLTAFEAKYQKDKALMPTQFVRTYGEVPFSTLSICERLEVLEKAGVKKCARDSKESHAQKRGKFLEILIGMAPEREDAIPKLPSIV